MKKFKKGFTLTELIVVFSIMGILGTAMFAGYYSYVDKSKEKLTEYELTQIVRAVDLAILEGELSDYTDLTEAKLEEIYKGAFDVELTDDQALAYGNNIISFTSRGVTYQYDCLNNNYAKR